MKNIHTIAIGEVLVEFSRDRSEAWSTTPSGDILNTLFYLGRNNCATALLTRFGLDPFRSEITRMLDREKIDISLCRDDPSRPNGLYFIATDIDGESSFHYRRSDSAARSLLDGDDLDPLVTAIAEARFLLVSGITLAILHNRAGLLELMRRVSTETDVTILFDPNVRPALWESTNEARRSIETILPTVDIFLPSAADLATLWGESHNREEIFRGLDLDHVVVKCGAEPTELWTDGVRTLHPVTPAHNVRDTTGAGDAFNAGYIAAIGRGVAPTEAVRAGGALAARVVRVRGAIDETYRAEER